mgnify:CR=1 FL=1
MEQAKPREFKVLQIRDIPSLRRDRLGRWDKVILYELPSGDRYTVSIPREEFNEQRLIEAVRADIEERARWQGKTFRL